MKSEGRGQEGRKLHAPRTLVALHGLTGLAFYQTGPGRDATRAVSQFVAHELHIIALNVGYQTPAAVAACSGSLPEHGRSAGRSGMGLHTCRREVFPKRVLA